VAAGAALAAFAVLCAVALSAAPRLVEPDDFAYRASIVAMTHGHFLTLSTAQVQALAAQLPGPGPAGLVPAGIPQWVQLADGQWISEKDPGYPFLAAPFQALGLIRLAPLFYGALGCLGLYAGARRARARCCGRSWPPGLPRPGAPEPGWPPSPPWRSRPSSATPTSWCLAAPWRR
jgi:hypothetical protein